ncbi:hypothetical protein [Chitinophaga niabensis]|uniref:CarboxypepD_reg-like domain-containing protein n=1 Tax=Chitinophaga niabensis TaxID=536979 RepID=A0A1N6E2T8_9BACT|nr:hypothetical protein [Chitinophaga niabensis]SIN77365.1 hypothetical protein SAMN04488055_1263 [Chitinophaga niabensis]
MNRLTLLFLLLSSSLFAQDSATITGKLFDEKTNTPIKGGKVQVFLQFSGAFVTNAVCDSLGQFSIRASRSLEDEFLNLIYSGPGFITEKWTVTGVRDLNLGITTLERARRRKKH